MSGPEKDRAGKVQPDIPAPSEPLPDIPPQEMPAPTSPQPDITPPTDPSPAPLPPEMPPQSDVSGAARAAPSSNE